MLKNHSTEEAISAIMQSLNKTTYDEMTNEELEYVMYGLNIGICNVWVKHRR